MKRDFKLDILDKINNTKQKGIVNIVGEKSRNDFPYVRIEITSEDPVKTTISCIRDKDLEKFAVNILRSLNSKYLKK